jgi:hypothetical protein
MSELGPLPAIPECMNEAAKYISDLVAPLAAQVVTGKTTPESAASKLEAAGVPDALTFLCVGIAAIDSEFFGVEYAF